MKKTLLAASLFLALIGPSSVFAASESQLSAISTLGELNGIALQCRYIEQMQKIKKALVVNLPKRRELGLLFEQNTNEAFMDFINENAVCPNEHVYFKRVNQAIESLEVAFRK